MAILEPELEAVPEALHGCVLRWWERASGEPVLVRSLAGLGPAALRELPRVLAASEFVAAALLQDPAALVDDGSAAGDWRERIGAATDEDARRMLREWRRRRMVAIAWRDIVGRASVRETLRAVSDLADACIEAALGAAQRQLAGAFGMPYGEDGQPSLPIVLGMGKLGGRELNFSSDVDLVLLFTQAGETRGARVLDNQEYFQRLAREFIRMLDSRTGDGFVFRVDLRLRPFGDSGPLVVSLAALEEYLQEQGRDWERYAWLKVRPIVGAPAFAATHRDYVRPFVYRRYLDFGVFDSLREMKALIARQVARRDLELDLKLGVGGIREAEFIAQSFQLVRGGSDRRLQSASLLEVMPQLAGSKYLSAATVEGLTAAYLTLRKAENAVQMLRDEQSHALPEEPLDRARVALMLHEPDWPAALARIEAARGCVAREFEALVFAAPGSVRADAESGLAWLEAEDAGLDEELGKRGLPSAAIPAVAAALGAYARSAPYRKLDEAGRRRLHVVLSRLIAAAARHTEPAEVILRVLRILEAIGARSSYLALLREQPPALDRLIEVCAISGFLARQIAEFPLLLDELIDQRAFEDLPSRAGFARELAARTERLPPDDPERQVEGLRQFQKAAIFAVALADQTGRLPLMSVSDRLTDIAELIIQCCMDLAWQQMTQIYGAPLCGADPRRLRTANIAVAGYGKLGGLELGYGSDLDLVFLHDSAGEVQQTGGERPIDNGVFFLRLGQRIVHLLTMHSASGRLYEVDMRLRPNGKGGFLMTGIDSFERYQQSEAWTWEHQALLRARAVAGDEALRQRFETVRRRVLTHDVRRDRLRADVMEMRARMRRELSLAGEGQFDIKQDSGGIADIEFLVQYWVLGSAHRHAHLIDHTDNVRQLEALAHYGVVPLATAQWLTDAYRGYRAVLHRLSLESAGERVVDAAEFADRRAGVEAIWRQTFADPAA